jgi:hypothetical protein
MNLDEAADQLYSPSLDDFASKRVKRPGDRRNPAQQAGSMELDGKGGSARDGSDWIDKSA